MMSIAMMPRCIDAVERGRLGHALGPRLPGALAADLPGPGPSASRLAASAAFLAADGADLDLCRGSARPLLESAAPRRDAHSRLDLAFSHALTAVFFDLPQVWEPQVERAAPGPSGHYGGNLRALAWHLATAAQNGGDFESIRAPVDGCLAVADTLLETASLDTYGLVLLGLVAGHTIGGHPLDDTLSWWGRYLKRAAGITDGPVELPSDPVTDSGVP